MTSICKKITFFSRKRKQFNLSTSLTKTELCVVFMTDLTHSVETGAGFLEPIFGAGFWTVCRRHNEALRVS